MAHFSERSLKALAGVHPNLIAVDPESGLPHLEHVACNVAFLLDIDQKRLTGSEGGSTGC